jgi:tetratricopeptide (TPR) repeat protein
MWILLVVFAAGTVAGAAGAADREAVERHWKLARDYQARGMRDHAREEARVVLRLDPAHEGARSMLGEGKAPATPSAARSSAAASPAATSSTVAADSATAFTGAVAPEQADLFAEARKAYRDSRVEDARRLAGEVLAGDPAHEGAMGLVRDLDEEAYQASPLSADSVLREIFEQGMAFYRREEWTAAAEAFQKGLAVSPSHDQTREFFNRSRARAEEGAVAGLLKRGRDALAAGRNGEAVTALKKVLEVKPDHAEARELLESVGAGPQATARKAMAKDHFNLGVGAYEKGDWAEAVRQWELVTGMDPSDKEAAKLLRKARGKLTAARKEARTRIPAMHEEGLKLYQQGKLAEAAKVYRQILELDPADEKAKKALELIEVAGGR